MVQSAEYPDLQWVPPRWWTNANRTRVQLIVIHTTEGSSHPGSAEAGAAHDQVRTKKVSTHYFHDSDSTVQCVRTEDLAYGAREQGNRRGIHHELCARAKWKAANWSTDYAVAMLARAAKQAARDAEKWDIPVRRLTAEQVADGEKGFCEHWDVSRAFPKDKGTHWDPGKNFPWSRFLDMVRDEMEEELTPEDKAWHVSLVETRLNQLVPQLVRAQLKEMVPGLTRQAVWDSVLWAGEDAPAAKVAFQRTYTYAAGIPTLATALGHPRRSSDEVDEPTARPVLPGLMAGLDAEAIAAAIPPALAEQVMKELSNRLQD